MARQTQEEKKEPFVDIIIVSYNGENYLPACLSSLQELDYPKNCYKITIIDNASLDNTISSIQHYLKQENICIIQNSKNLGFGKANNIGMHAATSATKYIILLNQDSLVGPRWLKELVDAMEKNPKAGACGATQMDYKDYKKNNGTYKKYGSEKENGKRTGEKNTKEKKWKECLWMGCGSIILRKQALDEVGYFDPYYFMYVEDIDLTWRLKIAGWTILHAFNAPWFHEGKYRKLTYNNKRLYWAWKNRIYLLFKFGSWSQIKKSFSFYYACLRRKHEQRPGDDKKIDKNHKQKEVAKETAEGGKILSGEEKKHEYKAIKFLHKLFFLCKLLLSIPFVVPQALVARKKLRKDFSFDAQEVDVWIRYIDHVLVEA